MESGGRPLVGNTDARCEYVGGHNPDFRCVLPKGHQGDHLLIIERKPKSFPPAPRSPRFTLTICARRARRLSEIALRNCLTLGSSGAEHCAYRSPVLFSCSSSLA
jgi:hypothetical protein